MIKNKALAHIRLRQETPLALEYSSIITQTYKNIHQRKTLLASSMITDNLRHVGGGGLKGLCLFLLNYSEVCFNLLTPLTLVSHTVIKRSGCSAAQGISQTFSLPPH